MTVSDFVPWPQALAGKRVLELGAGTALVSLAAAALGADAVATDIPACVAGVTAPNIAANRGRKRGARGRRRLLDRIYGEPSQERGEGTSCALWARAATRRPALIARGAEQLRRCDGEARRELQRLLVSERPEPIRERDRLGILAQSRPLRHRRRRQMRCAYDEG